MDTKHHEKRRWGLIKIPFIITMWRFSVDGRLEQGSENVVRIALTFGWMTKDCHQPEEVGHDKCSELICD